MIYFDSLPRELQSKIWGYVLCERLRLYKQNMPHRYLDTRLYDDFDKEFENLSMLAKCLWAEGHHERTHKCGDCMHDFKSPINCASSIETTGFPSHTFNALDLTSTNSQLVRCLIEWLSDFRSLD